MTYSDVVFGGITLKPLNMVVTQVPATRKQKMGTRLIKNDVFTDVWDYRIEIKGLLLGSAASIASQRVALIALQDCEKHAYADGNTERNGNYIIDGGIVWEDDPKTASPTTNLVFNMVLIQDQFE